MNETERKAAEKIKARYAPAEEKRTKLDELRRLDAKATRPAEIFAYTFGTAATLLLGFGMCLAMKVLFDMPPVGIVIGCVGILAMCVNYPIGNLRRVAPHKVFSAEMP